MKVKTFLDKDFKQFSTYDCFIKLPSLVDGFKTSQRKLIHTLVNNDKRWKLEALAPFAQSYTLYHHGATSLEGVAVGMAQDYVGANNINYLIPDGSFGNRLKPVAAASRYIHVDGLNKKFHQVFSSADNNIMEYHNEDGVDIEPLNYLPLLPNVLINGSEGIGTGFASMILQYNPNDLIKAVKEVLSGKPVSVLVPWYKGFNGSIKKINGQTTWTGIYKIINTTTIQIDELPIGFNQDSYTDVLDKLIENGSIKDYTDKSRMGVFNIEVKVSREFTQKTNEQIIQILRLEKRESENITGWSYEKDKLVQFNTIEEYIVWWVNYRLTRIEDRKTYLVKSISDRISWLEIKMKFIRFYLKNTELFSKSKKVELQKLLLDNYFIDEYHDKLLDIKIYNLTLEQIEKLQKEIDEEKVKLADIGNKTIKEIYFNDLKEIKL